LDCITIQLKTRQVTRSKLRAWACSTETIAIAAIMTRTSRQFIYFCTLLLVALTFTDLPLARAVEATLTQQARLLTADVQVIDHTGYSVAIEDNMAVVGGFNTNAAEIYSVCWQSLGETAEAH
jgi:hypothetical protein